MESRGQDAASRLLLTPRMFAAARHQRRPGCSGPGLTLWPGAEAFSPTTDTESPLSLCFLPASSQDASGSDTPSMKKLKHMEKKKKKIHTRMELV